MLGALRGMNRFLVGQVIKTLSSLSDQDLDDLQKLFPDHAHELNVMVKALRKDQATRSRVEREGS